jgi:RNA polymerase sigma-70 factor, ECF subfamily
MPAEGARVVASAAGRQERFRRLVTGELDRLYGLAYRLVGRDAEDAVQDCLLKAFRSLDRLSDEEAAGGWFTAILVNCCRDRGRARQRRPDEVELDEDVERFSLFRKVADEDPFPYSDSLHVDFLGLFGRDDLHAVLLDLPEIYRVPLVLVHMEGYSTREVAELVDAPLGTVLARLHRGRKLLEKRLWEYAESHGLLEERTR